MDAAYVDELDGRIPEDFWERKMIEWRSEEQEVSLAIARLATAAIRDRAPDAERLFELANKAYSLYVSQHSTEQTKLLSMSLPPENVSHSELL